MAATAHRRFLLAIDQGTTSTRAILFDADGLSPIFSSQREFAQHYPADGFVEHDAEEIWQTVAAVCENAADFARKDGGKIAAVGIANQRETTVLWARKSGKPIANAIVWQDRRTADICASLKKDGAESIVRKKTGLLLDPYFSATKIAHLLDKIPNARKAAESGEILFGTMDSFLIWRLTGGKVHATDITNASRTALFNLRTQQWDDELLALFRVPKKILPTILESADDFGEAEILGDSIFIGGVAGDQQSAAIGQACIHPGDIKSTYGTGCFMLAQCGDSPVIPPNQLLATAAYSVGGKSAFAIEGSIFSAGAAVQWMRDGIGVIKNSAEVESLAAESDGGVFLVPAFTGLGAPHWKPNVRGAIFGLTRAANSADIARAALDSVCCQTADLLSAMRAAGISPAILKADGGMVKNNWLMQRLADILNLPVMRPKITETTALGAAFLAGLKIGIFSEMKDIADLWRRDAEFHPQMKTEERAKILGGWRRAVRSAIHFADDSVSR